MFHWILLILLLNLLRFLLFHCLCLFFFLQSNIYHLNNNQLNTFFLNGRNFLKFHRIKMETIYIHTMIEHLILRKHTYHCWWNGFSFRIGCFVDLWMWIWTNLEFTWYSDRKWGDMWFHKMALYLINLQRASLDPCALLYNMHREHMIKHWT